MSFPVLLSPIDFRHYLGFGEYPPSTARSHFLTKFSTDKLCKTIVKVSVIFSTAFIGIVALSRNLKFSAILGSGLTLCSCLFLKRIQKKALLPPPELREPLEERIPRQIPTEGNSLMTTSLGEETFGWKKNLVQEACFSIEISGSICGGADFSELLSLIQRQMQKEKMLEVRVMTTAELITKDNTRLLTSLSWQYPNRFHYLVTSKNFSFFPTIKVMENHAKMFVVDEKYFICGGSGIQDTLNRDYLSYGPHISQSLKEQVIGTSSRDMDILVSGPSVKQFRQSFYRLWSKWNVLMEKRESLQSEYFPIEVPRSERATLPEFEEGNEDLVEDAEVSFVFGGPENGETTSCYKATRDLIRSAKKSVHVANMIFNEISLIRNLAKATKRNIPLTLITNGRGGTSIVRYFMAVQNRVNYHFLNQDYSEIYEYSVGGDLLHKKVMVIDEEVSVLGSYNISTKSAFCDDEAMVVVRSKRFAKKVLQEIEEDKQLSTLVTRREVKRFNSGFNRVLASILNTVICYTVN